ncbi:hypothetical protein [Vibrio tubiashii]|nr:hypothetical protein [Vibrio tubiashii]
MANEQMELSEEELDFLQQLDDFIIREDYQPELEVLADMEDSQ